VFFVHTAGNRPAQAATRPFGASLTVQLTVDSGCANNTVRMPRGALAGFSQRIASARTGCDDDWEAKGCAYSRSRAVLTNRQPLRAT
jgi:hypothetical protein